MKLEFENLIVVKNIERNRSELNVDGFTAFIDYKEKVAVITLIHAESPEHLAGRGGNSLD